MRKLLKSVPPSEEERPINAEFYPTPAKSDRLLGLRATGSGNSPLRYHPDVFFHSGAFIGVFGPSGVAVADRGDEFGSCG